MLIAFDIDGTLCDLSHRLHYVKPTIADGIGNRATDFEPNWDAFFAAWWSS